jgi:hypothetical protein
VYIAGVEGAGEVWIMVNVVIEIGSWERDQVCWGLTVGVGKGAWREGV